MSCSICSHSQRYEIECAVLRITPENKNITVEAIAKEYGVPVTDLQVHALMHTPLVVDTAAEQAPSLARQMKLREADALNEVVNEYLVTLKALGKKIKSYAAEGQDGVMLAKYLTKPVADTYINLGGEIRQSIKTMAELNQILNGKPDGGLSGLEALAKALHDSDKT